MNTVALYYKRLGKELRAIVKIDGDIIKVGDKCIKFNKQYIEMKVENFIKKGEPWKRK